MSDSIFGLCVHNRLIMCVLKVIKALIKPEHAYEMCRSVKGTFVFIVCERICNAVSRNHERAKCYRLLLSVLSECKSKPNKGPWSSDASYSSPPCPRSANARQHSAHKRLE